MKRIKKIIDSGLCLGCGFCEAIVGREKCKMIISPEGFYRPQFNSTIYKKEIKQILKVCPGIKVKGVNQSGVWGNILAATESWSLDNELRRKSATGGFTSSIAIYLLESKKVDAILQVGVKNDSWLYNELIISRTKEDVFSNAQSRYAPALVFDKIKIILDSSSDIFCFIGKPCDIAGIENFIEINPQYKGRIKYTLAIFCAGIPSYNATHSLISRAGLSEVPILLKYRGDGWPGNFRANWNDGQSLEVSYDESWGKVLGRTLGIRCKICPDGIGMLADISTGDSWNTKDGYPDFKEADGINFCFIRTPKGEKLYNEAVREGYIFSRKFEVNTLQNIHRYQYSRRLLSAWRVFALQIMTFGFLKFNGLGLLHMFFKINIFRGVKEFLGTIKRFYHKKSEEWIIFDKSSINE